MKKWLITIVCVTAMAAGNVAASEDHQGKGRQGGDRKERMERMREHLDLTDEQVEQIREIRKNGGGRDEVRAVLNEDQQAQLDAARARHREKKGHGQQDAS